MGFNSAGAVQVAKNLEKRPTSLIVGINIAKNKETPLQEAHRDYETAFEILYPYGDFFVVNVSSPNTPGLRSLQSPEALHPIIETLQSANHQAKPLLLKLSPDLTRAEVAQLCRWAKEAGINGFVAGNTTTSITYADLGPGGVSGAPLSFLRDQLIQTLSPAGLPIIGCGGILSAKEANSAYKAGAQLIEIYTGLVYRGPSLIEELGKINP
jgi:dihydroorotate dehydrogenase